MPLRELPSSAKFVVLDPEGSIIAECESTPEAVKVLATYLAKHPHEQDAAIFRRNRHAWVKY